MGQPVHTSRISITRENGPIRKAVIEGFSDPIYYGVHGGIKNFYRVDCEVEHAATLDHMVAAIGGWMMGTLATGLAGQKILTRSDLYSARVEGDIEAVDGVLRITRIRVDYSLKVPTDKADDARKVFASYIQGCPAAVSVRDCIDIIDTLNIVELENG